MPRLKKHPPESRSEKQERIAEQYRQNQLVCAQQIQLRQEHAQFIKEWHSAWDNRLDSDEAYAHLEAFYRQHIHRLSGGTIHDPEVTLTMVRYHDGKPIDLELVVSTLEQKPRYPRLLDIAKQLASQGIWSEGQTRRLQEVVLKHLAEKWWHRGFTRYCRLARVITDDAFEARVRLLLAYGGAREEMATRLLEHLEQDRKMRVGRPRKR